MTQPLVTIGIPCYNAGDTIRRALESAFRQDWPNVEIVIVDDLSSDNSADIVERAISGRPEARLIRHDTNTGPAGARNTILAAAAGEFVAFFDDDDEALPTRIAAQVRCLEAHEKRTGSTLVACYASGARRYGNGYVLDLPAIGSKGPEGPNGPAVAEYLLLYRRRADWFYGSGTPACALLARRSTFEVLGGFDPDFRRVEDVDFAVRLALRGGHFVGTAEPLFIQYSTGGGDKTAEINLIAEQALARKHDDYLGGIGQSYYALHWPLLRYWHFKRRYGRLALELLGLVARHPMSVTGHFFSTGPRRWLHERRMRQGRPA
ncbi:MAG: glycosyltransferase family 2 protein [Rhodospirillales bacterium]|nr:MAG: glycosyltransferase family 2 protein [Rhodospirillales bacterium]